MTEKALQVATAYAQREGFDGIERAGEKNGEEYFHYWFKGTEGHKLGLPLIIAVNSETLSIRKERQLKEIMWTLGEMEKLRNAEQQL